MSDSPDYSSAQNDSSDNGSSDNGSSDKDRSFDNLAERFARNVYGGLKGEIRLTVLWADLQPVVAQLAEQRNAPLRVLDVGGGLGQLAVRLAELGHHVTFNDLSPVMLASARRRAKELALEENIQWLHAPYQTLPEHFRQQPQGFDLILCHALLEWLERPERLVPTLTPLLQDGGYLSLCFYNPVAKIYRNLIRGNFDLIDGSYRSNEGSLTPNNPSSLEQVRQWLTEAGLTIELESGLRVFHDYVVEKRGGHLDPQQVLKMELAFSRREPYKWLGRYLHILARKPG